MCGRYSILTNLELLKQRFLFKEEELVYPPDPADVRPDDSIIIVTNDGGQTRGENSKWGFPYVNKRDLVINARVESLNESPLWKRVFPKHRCLVLADGYYEWQNNPDRSKTQVKFDLISEQPFAMAGVWGWFRDRFGQWGKCSAVITIPANELVQRVHVRMPAILNREAESIWLDPLVREPGTLVNMLEPFTSEDMKSRNNDAKIVLTERMF